MWGVTFKLFIFKIVCVPFQSTLPVWGVTYQSWFLVGSEYNISIHTPRVGSDPLPDPEEPSAYTFQSTLPVWGVTLIFLVYLFPKVFQSTLPVWGVTTDNRDYPNTLSISIHTPRVGSDNKKQKGA